MCVWNEWNLFTFLVLGHVCFLEDVFATSSWVASRPILQPTFLTSIQSLDGPESEILGSGCIVEKRNQHRVPLKMNLLRSAFGR